MSLFVSRQDKASDFANWKGIAHCKVVAKIEGAIFCGIIAEIHQRTDGAERIIS